MSLGKTRKEKTKHYSLSKIDKCGARYNFIFGERSNGKTFAVLDKIIRRKIEYGEQGAIIRRYEEDFKGQRGSSMFNGFVANEERGNLIEQYTNGEWTNIAYKSRAWYFCRVAPRVSEKTGKQLKGDTIEFDELPLAYGFSLSGSEHDKSTSFPLITTILFDEAITRDGYIVDEFVRFTSILSTIIRKRDNVTIYMCGNTVNRYCPYFKEMGLTHAKDMKQGDLDVYEYGENAELKVAVEYTEPNIEGKKSDVYFMFNNPKLKMVTHGAWELDIYPHCPFPFKRKDIVFTYFIEFDENIFQCEIVSLPECSFTFIHEKTTPFKNPDKDIIFTTEHSAMPNRIRNIGIAHGEWQRKILSYYKINKVFFQNNEVGDAINNYFQWCGYGGLFN